MKKLLILLLTAMMTLASAAPAFAADDSRQYLFELSLDGKDQKQVSTGDTVTVNFTLKRTDSDEAYDMYAAQDKIKYDSDFFELVPGSAIVNKGIETTDIDIQNHCRELYMSFLSMEGGTSWERNTMIGSFQLRVKGTEGASVISNEDCQVSVQDGSDTYAFETRDVTVVVTDQCVARFETNGGSEVADQSVLLGGKLQRPKDPEKPGCRLENWYKDPDLTNPWNFADDKVRENMTLYAGWTDEKAAGFPYWWIIVAAGAAAAALVCVFYRKRKKKKAKETVIKE